jgi:hypothetical protein
MYLWQQPRWPEFNWDARTQAGALADAHKEQGRLLGRMEALGFESRNDTCRLGMDIDGLTTRGPCRWSPYLPSSSFPDCSPRRKTWPPNLPATRVCACSFLIFLPPGTATHSPLVPGVAGNDHGHKKRGSLAAAASTNPKLPSSFPLDAAEIQLTVKGAELLVA